MSFTWYEFEMCRPDLLASLQAVLPQASKLDSG